jgi:hypothetical protein
MVCCLSRPEPSVAQGGEQGSISIGATLTSGCTKVKDGIVNAGSKLAKGARHVYDYVTNNIGKILKFLVSWGVILSFVGMLYGFSATAEPLAIGLGCGAGFGALLGVASALMVPKWLEKNKDKNTLYSMMTYSLWEQDEGTKALLTTVAVTVVFAAIAVFPLEVGVFMGVLVGNHIIVNLIYYDKNKQPVPNHDVRLADVGHQVNVLRRAMELANPGLVARAENDVNLTATSSSDHKTQST